MPLRHNEIPDPRHVGQCFLSDFNQNVVSRSSSSTGEPYKILAQEYNPFNGDRPLCKAALLASDWHQVSVNVIGWFRPYPKDQLGKDQWKGDLI